MSLDYSAALEQFYQQHQPWLLNYLQQGLSSLSDAEDLCQQVFLQLCVTPELLVNIDKPRPWLAAVTNRLSIDLWRKNNQIKNGRRSCFIIAVKTPPHWSSSK